jgi:hypothetical protein
VVADTSAYRSTSTLTIDVAAALCRGTVTIAIATTIAIAPTTKLVGTTVAMAQVPDPATRTGTAQVIPPAWLGGQER